ncbi:hypothetical protein WICANDRAFT_30061 [Wickerhamomyces anomalus NRRL Y-366-8]|uniref:RGS domain-containing protein n=1 Tax=Wickerhamomyces anomalus (strain ATCC 58044 / CBS 1984 / NCYC 433 / NRRL Y-366-8) TaxID=683960 RepID=A0A1E3P426_WICAA|nr:uncharacterized protein WICANDRAFT_30061 [Wickerhamomyces anomalus NRRL Y-366-8]ODQ60239.1 hypothetical protein WICANDRAFT_30061 [Wickerhamomyces anomalus NRRL Y-366-8]
MSSPFKPSAKQTLLPNSNINNLLTDTHSIPSSFGLESNHTTTPYHHERPTLNRLPTLYEVLNRRTEPPVDLWSFYIYMRDYQNSVDYLDFWIDVITHLRLCKDYVKGLRESLLLSEKHKSSSDEKKRHTTTSSTDEGNGGAEQRASVSSSLLLEALLNEGFLDDKDNKRHKSGSIQEQRNSTRILPEQLERYTQNIKNGNISRTTLKSSSRNILNTYFQDSSPRKLQIPDRIIRKIKHDVELQGRDDPEVFDDARNYVYNLMERECFPFFLQKNALHNLNNKSCLIRLILGLFWIFAGFWISYVLIFINIKPKAIRAVIIVPFLIGVYLILSFLYKLDPIMVFAKYSDNQELYQPKNQKLKKWVRNLKEPFVLRLLKKRALWVIFLVLIITAILSILFGLVPGHRL